MSRLAQLERLVGEGELRVVSIVGVPRSVSTALGRAIGEASANVTYINEPFNRDNRSLEVTAGYILDASKHKGASTPTVVTKNMASYIGTQAYEELEQLAGGTIWSIRDPLVQIGSLLTRIVNDLFIKPGADTISQDQIAPYLDDACSFLLDSEKSKYFSKTGWQSISNHFGNSNSTTEGFVVDGDKFLENPERVLMALCDLVCLPYSPTMVSGWRGEFVNVINKRNPQESIENAWTTRAASSSGIQPIVRPKLDIDTLPPSLRNHIMEIALPTYQAMTEGSS